MWLLSFSMAKLLATLLTILLTPKKNADAPPLECREIGVQERIYKYFEAVTFQMNSYATDNLITSGHPIETMSLNSSPTRRQYILPRLSGTIIFDVWTHSPIDEPGVYLWMVYP